MFGCRGWSPQQPPPSQTSEVFWGPISLAVAMPPYVPGVTRRFPAGKSSHRSSGHRLPHAESPEPAWGLAFRLSFPQPTHPAGLYAPPLAQKLVKAPTPSPNGAWTAQEPNHRLNTSGKGKSSSTTSRRRSNLCATSERNRSNRGTPRLKTLPSVNGSRPATALFGFPKPTARGKGVFGCKKGELCVGTKAAPPGQWT